MVEMNLTQIRCLILLKMLMKTHVNSRYKDTMKSFYLKTALFYMVEEHYEIWNEKNILNCVVICLNWLKNCVDQNNIPHYFQPSLDMFEGRMDTNTRQNICHILESLITDTVRACLEVNIDSLGDRLRDKLNTVSKKELSSYSNNKFKIGYFLSNLYIDNFPFDYNLILKRDDPKEFSVLVKSLENRISICDVIAKGDDRYRADAAMRFFPLHCSTLGILKINQLGKDGGLSGEPDMLLKSGFGSDAASGRLKYATALYHVKKYNAALGVLRKVELDYDVDNVIPVCLCYRRTKVYMPKKGFSVNCIERINDKTLYKHCAFCVVFTNHETHCIPDELRCEMNRVPSEQVTELDDKKTWLKWACVDSLPYLYFLVFELSGKIGDRQEKSRALGKLKSCIETENLNHKETALNLLGQCLEKEDWLDEALECYRKSLEERSEFNAAFALMANVNTKQRKMGMVTECRLKRF